MSGGAFAAAGADFSITAKPNCSLAPNQKLWIFSAIASFSLIVAMGFTLAGAWLVFPLPGWNYLPWALLSTSYSATPAIMKVSLIAGDDLAIEKRVYRKISRVVFHRYWARVILRVTPGGEQRLWLHSHGKEVEFGRYMNNDARLILASQLRRRTGAIY